MSNFVDFTQKGMKGLGATAYGFGYYIKPEGIVVSYKDGFFALPGLSLNETDPIVGEVLDSICFCLERSLDLSSSKSAFLLLVKEPEKGDNILYCIESRKWKEPDTYGPILHLDSFIKQEIIIGDSDVEIRHNPDNSISLVISDSGLIINLLENKKYNTK